MKYSDQFWIYAAALYIVFCLNSCTERDRLNPFDPAGTLPAPIDLFVRTENHQAHLSWTVKQLSDYRGFRLYRAEDEGSFQLLREFPAEVTAFTDTLPEYYRWYAYRISVLGQQRETPLSSPVKIYTGPGKIWVLSRYGYAIRQLSYDLLHTHQTFFTNYPPVSWAWDISNQKIWMAHAQFRNISRLNIATGREDFFIQNDFNYPLDIQWDQNLQQVTVLDPENQTIYLLRDQTVIDSILLPNENFFKILVGPQSQIVASSSNHTAIFNSTGIPVDTILFSSTLTGKDIYSDRSSLYLLSSDPEQLISEIIRYRWDTGNRERILLEGNFSVLRVPPAQDYYCLGEILESNYSRVVKLSPAGNRLLELPILTGRIDDIHVNQYDQSIFVVQRYQDHLVLYLDNGEIISGNTQIYDPIKIFIE